MRHAYLILAHTDFEVLRQLVKASDDERIDMFIHFDSKVKALPELTTEKAGLFILKDRVDVRWADVSMVDAEFRLCEAALANGTYDYFHLLSGVDLPLRSVGSIDRFFTENAGREFIAYSQGDLEEMLDTRARFRHLFPRSFRKSSIPARACRKAFLMLQKALGIRRNKDVEFRKGSQWFSITREMAEFFVSRKEQTMKMYGHSFCPDELVLQTLAWNSRFKERLWDTDSDARGCMRAISWKGSAITDWEDEDFPKLQESDAMFARKFSSSNPILVERVLQLQRSR